MENLDSPTGTAELEMGVATINVGINWNVLQMLRAVRRRQPTLFTLMVWYVTLPTP